MPNSRKPAPLAGGTRKTPSPQAKPGSGVPQADIPAQVCPGSEEKSQAAPPPAQMTVPPDSGAQSALLHALGLCARARALIFGAPMVCDAMRDARPPLLVLEASDTSENTHKKLTDKCTFYKIRHVRLPIDGATLATAVGKGSASLAALGVRDASFCRLLERPLRALGQ